MKKKNRKIVLDPPYYDEEEKEIIESINRGEWKSVPNLEEEIKKARASARYTLKLVKSKNINLRLTAMDIQKLKERAAENGMPYQTLAATVLHQFAHKKIKVEL